MSNLTQKQRDALKDSDFGDPARHLFPIMDQSDVDGAAHLIGKAQNPDAVKARIIAICKRKGFDVPDAWKETSKMSVTFALEGSGRRVDGDWAIYPNALLFQAGNYEDKGFSMSPEEMWLACDQFSAPVGGNIEHSDFLKGRACEVRSIRLDDADSFTLRGEVAVPLWLDTQLDQSEKKLSCEWDRGTKTLSGIGLVVHPRVEDAALMAAFAAADKHMTPTGQRALQNLHDMAASSGAVCSKGNANMASRHEATAVQQIHDVATEHGATCASMTPGQPMNPYSAYSATTATSAGTQSSPTKEAKRMTPAEQFMAWLTGSKPEGTTDPPPVTTSTAPAAVQLSVTTPDPRDVEMARMRQERDAAQAESNRLRVDSIRKDAVNFADRILKEGRITPAMRAAVIAKYECDALDDASYGATANFGADGQKVPRVNMTEEIFALAEPNQLSANQLAPALMSVLQGHRDTPTQESDRPATPEELEKLLNMTSQGQAVVAMSRGTNTNGHTNGRA